MQQIQVYFGLFKSIVYIFLMLYTRAPFVICNLLSNKFRILTYISTNPLSKNRRIYFFCTLSYDRSWQFQRWFCIYRKNDDKQIATKRKQKSLLYLENKTFFPPFLSSFTRDLAWVGIATILAGKESYFLHIDRLTKTGVWTAIVKSGYNHLANQSLLR